MFGKKQTKFRAVFFKPIAPWFSYMNQDYNWIVMKILNQIEL